MSDSHDQSHTSPEPPSTGGENDGDTSHPLPDRP